jgi:hypothetical protein
VVPADQAMAGKITATPTTTGARDPAATDPVSTVVTTASIGAKAVAAAAAAAGGGGRPEGRPTPTEVTGLQTQ